jgi:hypothetical protein
MFSTGAEMMAEAQAEMEMYAKAHLILLWKSTGVEKEERMLLKNSNARSHLLKHFNCHRRN